MRRRAAAIGAAVGLALAAAVAGVSAQRQFGGGFFGGASGYEPTIKNPEYNGQFTFARVKYTSGVGPVMAVEPSKEGHGAGRARWAHGCAESQRRA